MNPWAGPPTSGNSTPLRENIPESPTDGFPEFPHLANQESLPSTRRARAGTLPSRLSTGPPPSNGLLSLPSLAFKTSRPSPSHSPYQQSPSPGLEPTPTTTDNPTTLLSRLRAGSLPQRSPFPPHVSGASSPFGPNIFSSSWNTIGRERGSTLASIASVSSNGPSSPTQSQLSREGLADSDVPTRTLDYLGLVGTPQVQPMQMNAPHYMMPDFARREPNRYRSYSVNNKDTYQDEDYDNEEEVGYEQNNIESQYELIQQRLAATQALIRNHNLAVQAHQAAVNRPRARTVGGVLDSPNPSRLMGSYLPTPSRLDNSITAADLAMAEDQPPIVEELAPAVAAMNLGGGNSRSNGLLQADEPELVGPTSALWLGSIPTSTTTTTLNEMFKRYGTIHFTRVLTHKNCGFVNFERVEAAIAAKNDFNGKEIFPGNGPIRVNFAKPPSASNTPGHDGNQPSPSPVPFLQGQNGAQLPTTAAGEAGSNSGTVTPSVPPLADMTTDILDIVKQFGATDEEVTRMGKTLQSAIAYSNSVDEIPPVGEPTSTRLYDAPRLRDIRKRIDNQSLPQADIESIAHDMLPEIAELASDYLGNTVVQKLFEQCSDLTRDAMLEKIAPHLAEIGVHKNGTWAAQKIISVCKTEGQMEVIARHLRPYTVPLFLDQYGNYVLQGCLRFSAPYTDYIFETMMSKMWDIAQGRFGSRGMRACLESHHATKDQQRLLAATIALHSVQLATNHNAALLLTWFLDTCTFPHRRTVLAPQLVPCLVPLCTQKVAYLTVLKVINQKTEPDARDKIVQAMFFSKNEQTLESILRDSQCGATLIFKVITTPFFDEAVRGQVVENVKAVLLRIKAQPDKGYKRLMDEVGLSTRSGNGGGSRNDSHNERSRSSQRGNTPNHQQQREREQAQQQAQQAAAVQYNAAANSGQFYNPLNVAASGMSSAGFDAIPRSDSVDPTVQQQFPGYSQGGMPSMNMPYQQNIMRGQPPMNGYYPMQAGMPFPSPSPSIDQYRGSPIQPAANQSPYAAPAYPMPMPMNMNGFGYGMPPPGYNMPEAGMNVGGAPGRRGGRVGRNGGRNNSPRPY